MGWLWWLWVCGARDSALMFVGQLHFLSLNPVTLMGQPGLKLTLSNSCYWIEAYSHFTLKSQGRFVTIAPGQLTENTQPGAGTRSSANTTAWELTRGIGSLYIKGVGTDRVVSVLSMFSQCRLRNQTSESEA